MYDEATITYLAALYAELRVYEAKRDKAAKLLEGDDTEYRRKVLSAWEHAIGVAKDRIAQEEQRAVAVQS